MLFKSRYKELSVSTGKTVVHFENHELNTNDKHVIQFLKSNPSSDYACISDASDKQDITNLKLQARDAGYPDDVETAKKDDLIQFLESKK